jgi:hypothetical protein
MVPAGAQGGRVGGDVGFAVEFGERIRRMQAVGGRVFFLDPFLFGGGDAAGEDGEGGSSTGTAFVPWGSVSDKK